MERITIKGENLELEAPEGTMQFLAGTRDVGYYSNDFQNYRDRFIPDLSVFVEYPIRNKVFDEIKEFKYKNFNDRGIWDSFLNNKVNKYNFETNKKLDKDDHAFVIFDMNPYAFKDLHNMKEGLDLASITMVMLGICPKKNPKVRKIIGFELAKALDRTEKVVKHKNKLMVTTKGFFDVMIKKAIRQIRKVGKRFEDQVTANVREYLKNKAPGVWKTIDTIDRKVGFTKSMKHWHNEIAKFSQKYGGKIMNMAVIAVATYYGGPAGKMAATALLKVADKLSEKDKKVLKQVVQESGDLSKVDPNALNQTLFKAFAQLKDKMIKEKGPNQGEKDFSEFLNLSKTMIKEGREKQAQMEKEISQVKGYSQMFVFPTPLFQKLPTSLCPHFMACDIP